MTDTSKTLTRRTLVAALALAPLGGCAERLTVEEALGTEPRLPARRFRAVKIDTSPMVAAGVPQWANRVGEAVRRAAEPAFADMVDPRDRKAPVLTIRIDACDFPLYLGGRWRTLPFGSFGSWDGEDWIEGRLIYGSVSRRLLAHTDTALVGGRSLPDVDQYRIDALARVYVAWARREFQS
jgi:hypothetical protein